MRLFPSLILMLATLVPGLAAAVRPPNILWIVSEDNSQNLGCYGDTHARTPHLDRLARDGVRFTNAFVPYPVCSPSRASFLTGLYPQQNGHVGLATGNYALYDAKTPNIITYLRPAGYKLGLIGKLHINPASAFSFDFRAIPDANFARKTPVGAYVAGAKKFWSESADHPWFLSVNVPDAHLPFVRQADGSPAKPFTSVEPLPWVGTDSPRLREVTADYYNSMARLDDWVGELLKALEESGEAENTLVIYFSDHGAQFPRGKYTVYEGGLLIPMIARWPGKIMPGLVRDELVSTLDLIPTALKQAGVVQPAELKGMDLSPLFTPGPVKSWRQYIFGLTTGAMPDHCFVQESVRDDRWKLIWSPPQPRPNQIATHEFGDGTRFPSLVTGFVEDEVANARPEAKAQFKVWKNPPPYELYDLKTDPHEWKNLADRPEHAAVKERLIQALQSMQTEISDPFSDPGMLKAYIDEQFANPSVLVRANAKFRWSYLDKFRAWREARMSGK